MSLRRVLLLVAAAFVLLMAAVWLVLHSAAVQRPLAERALAAVEASTGWRVEVAEPRLRLWPGRLEAEGVAVSAGGDPVAMIDRIEATWSWPALFGDPARLESVSLEGVAVDLRNLELPEMPETSGEGPPVDPWRMLEIGRLTLSGGRVRAEVLEVEATLEEVRAAASLTDGRAAVEAGAGQATLERQGRTLVLGPVELRAAASADGVIVERLSAGGSEVALEASGKVTFSDGTAATVELETRADLAGALGWWDPNLVTGLDPRGVLELAGEVALDPQTGLAADLAHRGEPFTVAGYELETLELGFADGVPRARLAGGSWGEATVTAAEPGVATVSARLRAAPVERALAFAAPQVAEAVPGPIRVSGSVDGTVPFPVALENLSGSVDLAVTTSLGRAEVKASGAGDRWRLARARVETPGAVAQASGTLGPSGSLDLELELTVEDVSAVAARLEAWAAALADLEPAGGPISVRGRVGGSLGSPSFDVRAAWLDPVVAGRGVELVEAEAAGTLRSAEWSVDVAVAPGIAAGAAGSFDAEAGSVAGSWRLGVDQLDRLGEAAGLEPGLLASLGGRFEGAGQFAWDGSRWSVDGALEGSGVEAAGWRVDSLSARFEADPERVILEELAADLLGGSLQGSASAGLDGLDAPVTASLAWRDLDLAQAPVELDAVVEGRLDGDLMVAGTVSRPEVVLEAGWSPVDPASPVPAFRAAGALEDGVLRLVSGDISTEAGSGVVEVTASLGAFPAPEWLWPEAPDEAARVSVRSFDFRSEPLVAALGLEPLPVQVSAAVTVEGAWHPGRREDTQGVVELRDLSISHLGGELLAREPVVVKLTPSAVVVEPVALVGPRTEIRVEGRRDLASGLLEGRLDATVAPSIAQLIPYPLQVYQPISVSARLRGEAAAPVVDLDIRHEGGALVLRDPPLQIRDLVLSARWADGALWVQDGHATVNEGTVELAGGWDPASRQGLVAELNNVIVYAEGILSQWTGVVAIEPDPPRMAKVVGELNLVAGLWDENVSLTGALFGPTVLEPAADDPLYGVTLDLDVRGRGKIRVENNLGRFDARWDVLRVTGSAARPRIRGEVVIDPGGRFALAGQNVSVRRGSLLFTGDPAVDPIVEIVPESAVLTGDGGIDTTALATQGLVQGVGGLLGFENETLQPATISVETEKESSDNIMLGQRLSHNLALFLATSASDVQDQTSMLQLWNLPGLEGLAIQGYQKTLTEEAGANVFQRFRWGGTSRWDERPVISKIRFEGEWPVSKRALRRATGFRRGQPFEPFLLFVAKVRLERELAERGYVGATVTGSVREKERARILVFEVDPGPHQQVTFTGDDQPPERVRREVTALYQGPPLERIGFANMEAHLERFYDAEGYFRAEVSVERVGDEVVVDVQRGDGVEIVGPVLDGVPRDVALAVAARLGSPADLALLAEDEERAIRVIEGTLADQGFFEARVRSVEAVAVSGDRIELRADVDLGPPAVVGDLVLVGSDPLGLLRSEGFPLVEGGPLTPLAIDLASSRVRGGYDAAGYSEAQVRGSMEQGEDGRWTVTFEIEPGMRRTFEGVTFKGLKHTSVRSLESGVALQEGEILRNSDLDLTAVRVANFAPIERVDVRTVPVGATGARVELDIEEKPRWTAEVGGGWSTERGVQARVGVRDDNLFGRGLGLNLRARWDQTEWLGFVVVSLPPLPGKRWTFASTGGYSSGDAPDAPDLLNQDELFWSLEATRLFGAALDAATDSGTLYYRYTSTRTYEKEPSFFFPIDTTVNVSLLGARYVRDRFDNPFDPRSGYAFFLDGGVSRDVFGSELDYWTSFAQGSLALEVLGSSTWLQSLRVGIAEPFSGTELTREAKFFAGGQGSIRGFDRDTVGPTQLSVGGFAPAGGGALFILNEELRIPVWRELRAAIFVDAGQVWESWSDADGDLAVGAGVGFRWSTPIGPVWGDVSWPVANPGISSTKPKFYIGIGRPF